MFKVIHIATALPIGEFRGWPDSHYPSYIADFNDMKLANSFINRVCDCNRLYEHLLQDGQAYLHPMTNVCGIPTVSGRLYPEYFTIVEN